MKEISGDLPLSLKQKIYYLLFNFFKGIFNFRCLTRISFWYPDEISNSRETPGRKYLDAFLKDFFEDLDKGSNPLVLDIGCGRGYVRSFMADAGIKGSYVGLDVKKHKDFEDHSAKNWQSNFVESAIEDFETEEKFDLIFSNTALEHIKNDKLAVEKSFKFLKSGGSMIHVVPSFWSLFLYVFHGYRQYGPCSLKRLFGDRNVKFYRLGGLASFLLHFFYITFLERTLQIYHVRDFPVYRKLSMIAWKLDRYLPILSYMYIALYDEK